MMQHMKTAVFERQAQWWFQWWNIVDGVPLAEDLDGPFRSRDEAERARLEFLAARRERYPHELFENE